MVAGVDLAEHLDRFSRLEAFGGDQCRLVDRPCALRIRRATRRPRSRLAFACYTRHLIHVTAYPGQRTADALETLLHEVVHLASLDNRRHDRHFKDLLAAASLEAFGVDLRHRTGRPVYTLDLLIADALDASLAAPTT